jgi:hypothetical protein
MALAFYGDHSSMIGVFWRPAAFDRGRALPRGPEVARAPEPRLRRVSAHSGYMG